MVVLRIMIERPKINKYQTHSEVEVNTSDDKALREQSSDANTYAGLAESLEGLEAIEITARPTKALLSDLIREIRLDESEAGLEIWEEAEDDPGNEVWWFDLA
ncbi:MAG: hypothetical protein JOZ78_04725 [Chroococcidiopsidaceae cyanobacterium CP_BM_ER_R8_30]|nr:hypothetical protein [Chroococcidiopsidaceae cyanobacterium CP_BM_ER_R8_30]